MLNIRGTTIHLTRADTAFIKITPKNKDGTDYIIQSGDRLVFRIKQNVNDMRVVCEKDIDPTTCILTLNPEDTVFCRNDKDYRWEAELVTASGYHFTFIEDAIFHIGVELEVHRNG